MVKLVKNKDKEKTLIDQSQSKKNTTYRKTRKVEFQEMEWHVYSTEKRVKL